MHEELDVESYCEWGVDYLKLDACSGRGYSDHNTSWIKFRAAIDACSKRRGFPMVLSVESCDDPDGCGLWIGDLANLWRTCGDIQATFASVMRNVAENTKMAKWAGPTGGPLNGGHWNDAGPCQHSIVCGCLLLYATDRFSLSDTRSFFCDGCRHASSWRHRSVDHGAVQPLRTVEYDG